MKRNKAFGAVTSIGLFGLVMVAATPVLGGSPGWSGMDEPAPDAAAASAGSDLGIDLDRLREHIQDPESARPEILAALEAARRDGDQGEVALLTRILERADSIRRPNQMHLTLEEAIQAALANSYAIEVSRFSPAMATTQIVEAEAAFDAIFFTNVTRNKDDTPTGSQLASSDLDLVNVRSGITKLMSAGGRMDVTYSLRRTKTSFSFQQINPEYFNSLEFRVTQPLLRDFGVDFNRSLILIARKNKEQSDLLLQETVRDTVLLVEQAYWELFIARRSALTKARELAAFEGIYDNLLARKDFDITPVEIAATRARLEQARWEFVGTRATVFGTEDALIALMNSSEVNLADEIEILPDDFPELGRIGVERLAAVQTALTLRPEIKRQEAIVAQREIEVGRARNAELPQLDLTLSYTINGLSGTADRAFDKLTGHNFVDLAGTVDFQVPIGNRRPRAARRRAELAFRQARVELQRQIEATILGVNDAIRVLSTRYDQIAPSFEIAEASLRQVESLVARAERQDLATLNSELGARQSLANSRRAILRAIVDYNLGIIELQKAKGTFLSYNNIVISSAME